MISIARDSSTRSSASRSASSTTTNWPFVTSQPLTISSGPTSRSCMRAPALLPDRGQALAVQRAERDVRLPRSRFGRRREADRDIDQSEADRAVPHRPHTSSQCSGTDVIRPRPRLPFRSTMAAAWPRAPPRSPTRPFLCGRGRSDGSGATRSRSDGRRLRTSSRPTTGGARSPGPRPRRPSTSWRTACSRSASARATPSRFSRRRGSSGRCSTSRSALVGAVGAAIYASSSPNDCVYVLEHSDAVGVLAEDEAQRAKLEGVEVEPRPRRSPTSTRSASAAGRSPPSTRTRSHGPRRRSARRTSSPSSTPRARPGRRRPA